MTVITYDFTPSKLLKKELDTDNKQNLDIYATKTIQMDQVDYVAQNMYFAKRDKTGNVELVIEHSTAGSTNTSLYLRIPINTSVSSSSSSTIGTSISNYVNAKINANTTFNIDKDLPDNENIGAKKYIDGTNTVIVLDSTINVVDTNKYLSENDDSNSDSILFKGTIPFLQTPNNAKTVQLYQDNQIYIDCNPSGESAETIAAYNVPINSEYAKNEGKMNYERQAMYSGVFAIALVLIYFIVPWWYRTYVVESVINWMDTQSIQGLKKPNDQNKYSGEVRITLINKWLMTLCGLYLLVNFTIGISSDPDLLTQTTYVAIMIALSVISIIIKGENSAFFKHESVQLYEKAFSEGIDRDLDQAIDNRATFLSMATFLPVFSSLKIEGIPWFYVYVVFVFVFIGIFYGLQFGMNSDSTSSDSSKSKTVFDGIFYSTFVVLLAYMMFHRKPSEREFTGKLGKRESSVKNFKISSKSDNNDTEQEQEQGFWGYIGDVISPLFQGLGDNDANEGTKEKESASLFQGLGLGDNDANEGTK